MKTVVFFSMGFLMIVSMMPARAMENSRRNPTSSLTTNGPESVQAENNFNADFMGATNVNWKRTDNFYEATFVWNGKAETAFYDFDAKLVSTTQHVDFSAVPVQAQKEIKKRYKDYTIGAVIFLDDNEYNETATTLYGDQSANEDNWFVELSKNNKTEIVRVDSQGALHAFTSK